MIESTFHRAPDVLVARNRDLHFLKSLSLLLEQDFQLILLENCG